MKYAVLIAFLLACLGLVLGLLLLPFGRFRPRAKLMLKTSFPVAAISFVIFAIFASGDADKTAKEAGFADADDRRNAEKVGIHDVQTWRKRQEAEAAQRQAEIARREALLRIPVEERNLIQAVERARAAYAKAGQTELQRGSTRPARKKEICASVPSSDLKGWVGKIKSLSTNGSGEGVLKVEIAEDVVIETMNNSFSDTIYHTLIDSSSPLYKTLLGMKQNDMVRFDASLFRSSDDCYQETSLTLDGSIKKPAFVAHFDRVTRIDLGE